MITIISSTNRQDSKSMAVSNIMLKLFAELNAPAQVLSLTQLPHDFAFADLYGKRSPEMHEIVAKYVEASNKFIFVVPEYNGSFPGVLKTFIDAIPPRLFKDKKASIIGISDGHAGNLRGQEHLMGILQHIKMLVHYSKPKLSGIDKLVNQENEILDERTTKLLHEHAFLMSNF
jgi:NAD(P)H-dependent FMN reductase